MHFSPLRLGTTQWEFYLLHQKIKIHKKLIYSIHTADLYYSIFDATPPPRLSRRNHCCYGDEEHVAKEHLYKRRGQNGQRLHPSALSWMLMCLDKTTFSRRPTRSCGSSPLLCLATLECVSWTDEAAVYAGWREAWQPAKCGGGHDPCRLLPSGSDSEASNQQNTQRKYCLLTCLVLRQSALKAQDMEQTHFNNEPRMISQFHLKPLL